MKRIIAISFSLIALTLAASFPAVAAQTSPDETSSAAPAEGRSAKSSRGGRHWTRHTSYRSSGIKQGTSAARGKWSRNARRSEPPAPLPPKPVPAPEVTAVKPVPDVALSSQALVGVAGGGVTSTSARVASDLSAVLDSGSLRILPLMTRSSLDDLLALASADKADLAFLHADATAALAGAERARMTARISYVARLYNDEVHVIAARDVGDVRDLSGKKVNVGPTGSANAQTAELIFDRLGVVPNYVHLDQPTALAQLAAGDLAADVLVSGRPVKALQDFAGDGRFKLLAIPYDQALQDIYLPARIEATDYGNLVPPGAGVDTLAVPIVLATVDAPAGSPRAARVTRFTDALFDRFAALRDPSRHPKWRDVNLAADVANWTRFAAAQDAIDKRTARSVVIDPPLSNAFMPASGNAFRK